MLFRVVAEYDRLMRDLVMWGAMLSAEAITRYGLAAVLEAQRRNLITRRRMYGVVIYSARGRNLVRHNLTETQRANVMATSTVLSALLLRLALRELEAEGVRLEPHAPVNSPAARHLAVAVDRVPPLVVMARVELPPRTLQHLTNLYRDLPEFEQAHFIAYTLDPTLQERPKMTKRRRVELRLRTREQMLKYPGSAAEDPADDLAEETEEERPD